MDLGSIEDLLRPASLVERKKRLGLLDGAPTKKLAPTTITDTSKMHDLGRVIWLPQRVLSFLGWLVDGGEGGSCV